MDFFKFFKEADTDKTSFSRLSGSFLLLAYIFWGTYLVITTKQIPDFPPWLAITVGSLYGINKFAPPVRNFIQKTISTKGKYEKENQ